MLSIAHEEGNWNTDYFHCMECSSVANTVADLQHELDCPVGKSPDDVPLSVSDTSEDQLTDILMRVNSTYTRNPDYLVEELKQDLAGSKNVRWVAQESTSRFVVGLGRTSTHGDFHREDKRGLVLKLDPRVRYDSNNTPLSANFNELRNWRTAKETQTDQFFGEIFAAARDGMWLLMEECIPIRHSVRDVMKRRDVIYDRDKRYTKMLLGALQQNDWLPPYDYKNGNMGLTDDNVPVLIDYGSRMEYDIDSLGCL